MGIFTTLAAAFRKFFGIGGEDKKNRNTNLQTAENREEYEKMVSKSIYDKKTVRDIDVQGKRVLVRVDFNVPLTPDMKILDDTRIQASAPTVRYLREHGAKVIIMSHLGRPKGEIVPKFSLKVTAHRFGQILGCDVQFCSQCIGELPKKMIKKLQPGEVLLLENVRFHPEEEKNDPEFAEKLAELADIYVDDAFGTAHRYHASMEGVAHLLPAVAGLLLEKELVVMGKALEDPFHPFVSIMGGAKVSDKIGVIENLVNKVDHILVGGGIGNTFLAAKGYDMQQSRVNTESMDWAKNFLENGEGKEKLILPVDLIAADGFDVNARTKIVGIDEIPEGWMALDIGPKTVELFSKYIKECRTVVWNGPMGVFEMEPFASGTIGVASAVAKSRCTSIIGGGDSVAAVEKAGVSYLVSHISTGGGSTLKFLEGIDLPAIKVLDNME